MRINILLFILLIIPSIYCIGCLQNEKYLKPEFKLPIVNHDVSYTPFDIEMDNPEFLVCDSTQIKSGRNRIQYIGGLQTLKDDITTAYNFKKDYKSFNGFIVIRFIINCQGKSGRYRVEALNPDFTRSQAPTGLVDHMLDILKVSDHWTKRAGSDPEEEYSKFINVKFKHGKIEHVLL